MDTGQHWGSTPVSHKYVINEILPGMDVFDRSYRLNGSVNLTQETTQYYVNIESMFATGTLSIVPRDGVRYWHQDFNDPDYLAPYAVDDYVPYPEQDSWKFKAGKQLNYVLRHQIGRNDGERIVRCNQGAWVLVEDLLQIDSIWRDGNRYERAMGRNPSEAIRIKKSKVAQIVDLTIAERRQRGKSRLQILGLRADDERSLTDMIVLYGIKPPSPEEKPLGPTYNGWIMPVAIRATSGHSDERMQFELDPYMMMNRLDLKTALELQGGYHVTSPANLQSILENSIMPGGSEGKRVMSYFGVFRPWDRRNRSARTRSPIPGELWMLVIYIPPSELSRFGAGLSGSGDILVPQVIPPDEIKEIWIARNCSAERDQNTGETRWCITTPRKIFSRKLVDEIVTYADFKTLGIQGYMATRQQVIDDAIQLIKKFQAPPLGDPQDLEELKEDVDMLKANPGSSLKLEDEVRSRIVMKLALYHVPSRPKIMRMHDRKCPCCLTETPSFIAVCLFCHAEFWSVPESMSELSQKEKNRRISGTEKELIKRRKRHTGRHRKKTSKCLQRIKPEFKKMKKK